MRPCCTTRPDLPVENRPNIQTRLRRREEMSPLFMDTGYDPNSSGPESAEDCHSNTAGSEREGEGRGSANRGTKRRQKNRDAARKSRKKQTERADDLHEELQSLERSNTTLEKEIRMLKRDLHMYTTALERHEPHCRLKASGSGSASTSRLSVSTSQAAAGCSSPLKAPPKTSCSTLAPLQSLSSSLMSSVGLRTLDCLLPLTTLASSAEVFAASSSPPPPPPPYSFPTGPAPHSLFSKEHLITPLPTNAAPVCASLVSNPLPSLVLSTNSQPHSRQDAVHQRSSAAASALFQTSSPAVFHASSHTVPITLHSASLQTLQTLDEVSPYSHIRPPVGGSAGLATQPVTVSQFHPHPNTSSPPCALLSSSFPDPALQSLSVSPQTNTDHPPAPAFDLKPSQHQPTPLNASASLLSFLTVPSPINVPQTTSSSFDGLSSEPSRDLSFSELLEGNDWILSGNE